jgi:DNA polymerase I-like protein with 3'-5' exonuclease and polymerase domains
MSNQCTWKFVELGEVNVIEGIPLCADTETDGFYGAVELLQLYQEGWPHVLFVRKPNPFELAQFLAKHKSIWFNAHYDLTTVQQQTSPEFKCEYECVFLLARLALPTLSEYTFDAVQEAVLGYDPYYKANLNKKALQKSDWTKAELTDDQCMYGALDVFHMPAIYEAVKGKLDDISYVLDKSTVDSCLWFQWHGMPTDEDRLYAQWDKAEKEKARLVEILPPNFNPNSWQQVRKLLDVDESDDKYLAMLELKEDNEMAGNIRKYRKVTKRLSFLTKYDGFDGLLIGKFKPSARSGRLTSNDENLQQIPRALKDIFGYNKEAGRVLIYSDYAQVELRTICALLNIKLMEKMFREGVDLHGYVASILFGEDWTKDDRQVTKTYNFNLLYGGSVGMVLQILISYGYWIEERLANRHKAKWLNLFGEINKWQQESISQWRKGKLAQTPFGRQYKGKLMTDQMNIMNQGAGAEVAKLALHYFVPYAKANDIKIANFIHDSFILDCVDDPAVYAPAAAELAKCMQQAWFECSKLFKIKDLPMPIDVSVGYNWGDIEEGEGIIHKHNLTGMENYNGPEV